MLPDTRLRNILTRYFQQIEAQWNVDFHYQTQVDTKEILVPIKRCLGGFFSPFWYLYTLILCF